MDIAGFGVNMPPRIENQNKEEKNNREEKRKTLFRFTICLMDHCVTLWSYNHLTDSPLVCN